MILSDTMIRRALSFGEIKIDPIRDSAIGPNSYDVRLGPKLLTYLDEPIEYGGGRITQYGLDARKENQTIEHRIDPVRGFILQPGQLYLASTLEYTETHKHVPVLDGKSSTGRLGIVVHCTAGVGDIGFCGHWTLEIFVVEPVRIYAEMPIGQLRFFEAYAPALSYAQRASSKYMNKNPDPQPSQMWRNFEEPKP